MANILKKLKINLIGCGAIAAHHAEVILANGMIINSVVGSKNSKNVKRFAKRFKIKKYYLNSYEMFKDLQDVDGFVVAVPHEITLFYVKKIIKLGLPALIEKPLALNHNLLKPYLKTKNIKVAYNRRFYGSVKDAQKFVSKKKNMMVHINLPEIINDKNKSKKKIYKRVLSNSVHAIDLIYYLFFKPKIIYQKSVYNKRNNKGCVVIFRDLNNNLINLFCSWNSKTNWSFLINDKISTFELKPLEIARFCQNFKIINPTNTIKIRTYKPEIKRFNVCTEDIKFKPGFLNQMLEFKKFILSGKSNRLATIKNSFDALKVSKKLIS